MAEEQLNIIRDESKVDFDVTRMATESETAEYNGQGNGFDQKLAITTDGSPSRSAPGSSSSRGSLSNTKGSSRSTLSNWSEKKVQPKLLLSWYVIVY